MNFIQQTGGGLIALTLAIYSSIALSQDPNNQTFLTKSLSQLITQSLVNSLSNIDSYSDSQISICKPSSRGTRCVKKIAKAFKVFSKEIPILKTTQFESNKTCQDSSRGWRCRRLEINKQPNTKLENLAFLVQKNACQLSARGSRCY